MSSAQPHRRHEPQPLPPDGVEQQIQPERGWDSSWWRLAGIGAVAIILGLATLALLWLFSRPLALLVLAVALAEALVPALELLKCWLPRTVAVLLLYLAVLLVLVGIGWVVIPSLVVQLEQATSEIPVLVRQFRGWIDGLGFVNTDQLLRQFSSQAGQLSSFLLSLPVQLLASMFEILLVFVISIYWLLEGPSVRRFVLSLMPHERRERGAVVLHEMGHAMGGYIRGTILLGLVTSLLSYLGLLIIGVKYPLVLGLLVGLLELVSFIGAIIAGAVMVTVALLQSLTMALIVLGFVIALQQLENNILAPQIMHSQTKISPLLVIIALLAGGSVGGILGALVAIPLVAALKVFVCEVMAPAVRRRTGAAVSQDMAGEESQHEQA